MLAEEVDVMKHTCSRICGADLYLLMTLSALLHLLQWTLRPGQERHFFRTQNYLGHFLGSF